jgi:hypothetical protein
LTRYFVFYRLCFLIVRRVAVATRHTLEDKACNIESNALPNVNLGSENVTRNGARRQVDRRLKAQVVL